MTLQVIDITIGVIPFAVIGLIFRMIIKKLKLLELIEFDNRQYIASELEDIHNRIKKIESEKN